MSENIHSNTENEKESLTPEQLQELEDEILNEAAGGTDYPISPNIGC